MTVVIHATAYYIHERDHCRVNFCYHTFMRFYFLVSTCEFFTRESEKELSALSRAFTTFGIPVPQLISISCCRRETEQLSDWSSADVENYRLISLEGLEIRFTVSDGQDLFDFWQKSPIVLGQERDGPFVDPPKLDAGFAREIKRHRHALRTRAKRAKEEKGHQTLDAARERSNLYNRRDLFPHFFRFRRRAQLVIHGEYGDKQREGGTETAFASSLLSYRLWSITHCFGTHWLSFLRHE